MHPRNPRVGRAHAADRISRGAQRAYTTPRTLFGELQSLSAGPFGGKSDVMLSELSAQKSWNSRHVHI